MWRFISKSLGTLSDFKATHEEQKKMKKLNRQLGRSKFSKGVISDFNKSARDGKTSWFGFKDGTTADEILILLQAFEIDRTR